MLRTECCSSLLPGTEHRQECACWISPHQPHCINNPRVLAWTHLHVWKGEESYCAAAEQLRRRRRRSSLSIPQSVCAVCVCTLRFSTCLYAVLSDVKLPASACFTFTGFLIEIVARWADAPVGADQIQTRSCTTGAWIHCTFINIWEKEHTRTLCKAYKSHPLNVTIQSVSSSPVHSLPSKVSS